MANELTTASSSESRPPPDHTDAGELALALAWSTHRPDRVGEIAFVPRVPAMLGRVEGLRWMRQRPQVLQPTGPLDDPRLSREQLELQSDGISVAMRVVGRLPARVNGLPTEGRTLREGDVVEVGDRLVVLVHRRPLLIEGDRPTHPFGQPDGHGLVGEGPAAWALRAQIAFVARRQAHVLVLGESGTGKELVAHALHQGSPRGGGPLVTRNAATIPESLADAELFGNLAGYPNPGMAARPGLVGEADGGTLFLDEFGELPQAVQARLLRVLDSGEYTRLGEARARRADLRLVAATNRPPESLKHDVLARIPLQIRLPPLSARREDIALLAVHSLRALARADRELLRWFVDADPGACPRLTTRLVAALVAHPYRTHVRELVGLLWRALAESRGPELDLFPSYANLRSATPSDAVEPTELSQEDLQACLDRHGGRQELAWRELGLSSRHVLARLVKKHGLRVRGRSTDD